jgi:hypothetical protein
MAVPAASSGAERLTALSNDFSQFLKQIHGVGPIMRPLGRLGRSPKAG